MSHILRTVALYVLLALVLVPAVTLTWLRWEAGRPQEDRFRERHGKLAKISVVESITRDDPASTIFHWLAYGPTFDTAKNVADIAPRPVLVIGAREDERTPAGQTEALFAAALEPKLLRWTEGQHIEPGRSEIVADLLRIADEELPFDTEN